MGQAKETVKKWVELYNDGTPDSYGSDKFLELYAENIDWKEMPSITSPEGRIGNRETVRAAILENNKMLCNRHVELQEIVEEANIVAWAANWQTSLATDITSPEGDIIKEGSQLRLRMAVFSEVVDGLIVRQHEYISHLQIIPIDQLD